MTEKGIGEEGRKGRVSKKVILKMGGRHTVDNKRRKRRKKDLIGGKSKRKEAQEGRI